MNEYAQSLHDAFNQPRGLTPASYSAARDRHSRAVRTRERASVAAAQLLEDAELEFDRAQAELAAHELCPGIPRPECREPRTPAQIAQSLHEYLLNRDRDQSPYNANVELVEKLRELRRELARL
jgi:hypothetical protein